jgi:hypothetical protein
MAARSSKQLNGVRELEIGTIASRNGAAVFDWRALMELGKFDVACLQDIEPQVRIRIIN